MYHPICFYPVTSNLGFNTETGLDFYSFRDAEAGEQVATMQLEDIFVAGSEAESDFAELDFDGTPLLATLQRETVDLLWQGDAGYTITGSFAYSANIETDTVTVDNLEDLQV